MTYVLQELCHLVAVRAALRRHLIPDTPHYHARIVAPLMKHIHHVPFRPCHSRNIRRLIEEPVIAVGAFGNVPLVKRLNHHHQSKLITQAHKLGSRHIVRCPDSITAHVLKHQELMPECGHIDCRSQRSQVMMIAYPLEFAVTAVQEKSFFSDKFY